MPFIERITAEIEQLPMELIASVQSSLQQFCDNVTQSELILPENAAFESTVVKVWCCSQFVAGNCINKPSIIIDLVNSGMLFSDTARNGYATYLQDLKIASEAELMTFLRQYRCREMVRIAWRDLAGWSDLQETMADLTALAESCIQFALDFLYKQACEKRGVPVFADGTPQYLVVLGMGKLGAWELNYSSDIDLIFAYAEDGILEDRKATTYGEFFTRICRSLVKVLDEITADGFVFRTDIRLRPFGDSGPVVMTFDGMENYYQTQAREWERYAMIKARQVAGDRKSGSELMAMLKPFVYRRYLDYGAFEELRELKLKITEELKRKDRMDNIKIGPGGIREIEFIGQAFQLIRGGQEKSLQQRAILIILDEIGTLQLLPEESVATLKASYCFLRRVENHIQQYQDRQTHDLPAEGMAQQILAYSLDFANWKAFKEQLDSVRQHVQREFDLVFSVEQQDQTLKASQSVWIGRADQSDLLKQLEAMGYEQAHEILTLLTEFKSAAALKRLTAKGAGVIDRLMPKLLENLLLVNNPVQTLKRILDLLEAVAGRNVYLALLCENPEALEELIRLSSASPWISHYLSRYPALFDELLDTRTLFEPLNKKNLEQRLQLQLQAIDSQDFEQVMIALRKFKQINVLRVAAADIMQVIPIMVVSDYLTYIAEVILQEVVNQSWRLITEKHGVPPGSVDSVTGFGVLGFGKLGGIELGYGSDLDMVFLYDCENGNALTNGKKPISCAQFYGRLGQKVMTMLNTKMLSGMLYDVDMRLRPSGNSGLLVSHISVYEDYLNKEAWTWEHQALVRGRFIAGDSKLKDKFLDIRKKILCQPRNIDALRNEVRGMRQKMRENLDNKESGKFDLKHSKGGIADIEFIVQFTVLAWASQNQGLVAYTDNVRLLDGLQEQGKLSELEAETLKQAYCTYRDRGHIETLQENRAVVTEEEFSEMRKQVELIWREHME